MYSQPSPTFSLSCSYTFSLIIFFSSTPKTSQYV
ncbi:hypothetical protein D039_0270A, partial [Vibrio parahaemolyticus EKP-028]